jgi:uncharacterized protein (TIGR00255 family)
MSVYSMTGYATATQDLSGNQTRAAVRLVVDARSVNNRFLDLTLRLPDDLRTLEPPLRELVGQALHRGKVELRVSVTRTDGPTGGQVDGAALQQVTALQQAVQRSLPEARPLSVYEILQFTRDPAPALRDDLTVPLRALAQSVVADLVAARQREGGRLRVLLEERIGALRQLVTQAVPRVPVAVQEQQKRFLTRWNDALSGIDSEVPASAVQERALAEAAAFALRIDVAEELERLGAHLAEITDVLQRGGVIGKRLDFLIQELHREANTLGSKAATLALARISVDMKVLIEQMREQVQNIE